MGSKSAAERRIGDNAYTVLGDVYQPSTVELSAPLGTPLWRTSWFISRPDGD